MKTKEAHQLANPEILNVLDEISILKLSDCVNDENCHEFYNLSELKHELFGILIAQEKELEFLNEISKWHEEFSVAYIKMVDERREALKISNEDLRKVLK